MDKFRSLFPGDRNPSFVHAPGRVNVIGEHTDYNGLAVLPFAVQSGVNIIFAPISEPRIILHTMTKPLLEPLDFSIERTIPPYCEGHWGNYVKAAIQDGVNFAGESGSCFKDLPGLYGVVESDLPMNAGLSSSSALVVAAALAFFHVRGFRLDPIDMASRCASAERYVGTQGGAMDQTASLCGKKDHCLKIDFYPLEVEEIPANNPCEFLVAHSLVEAQKSGEAKLKYNLRVFECRMLTEIVNVFLKREEIIPEEIRYLGDITKNPALMKNPHELMDCILDVFEKEEYTLHDLALIIGKDRLDREIAGIFPDRKILNDLVLPLKKRAGYLLKEWRRVEEAADMLGKGDDEGLGSILFEAHEGLRSEFEVSHPRVDHLVELAREFGLPGARMTGAGFGGTTLHLVPPESVDEYRSFLHKQYYDAFTFSNNPIHVFRPSDGAYINPWRKGFRC